MGAATYAIFVRLTPAFSTNLARPGMMDAIRAAADEGRAPEIEALAALGMPEEFARLFAERLSYLIGLREQGVLLSAGPFEDLAEGLYLCRAEDEATARRVLENDPLYRAGFIEHEFIVRRWLAAI